MVNRFILLLIPAPSFRVFCSLYSSCFSNPCRFKCAHKERDWKPESRELYFLKASPYCISEVVHMVQYLGIQAGSTLAIQSAIVLQSQK